mmetsp:Transcript_115151/g.372178  ORF Transcript_115151/g.372178 Transcript_115151/m.372178 type:complete len:608 (-) Transcript_115151:326-2149(-)
MVEERHGEVILDEVTARAPEVHRVPETELPPHPVQELPLDAGVRRRLLAQAEGVVEDLLRQGLWRHASGPLAVEATLKEVRHSVVGHVDRGVAEALDQPLLVPRQLAAQAEGPRARPVPEPADGVGDVVERGLAEHVEVLLHVLADPLRPLLVAVLQVPLVAEGYDALVPGARHDTAFWLEVAGRLPRSNEVLFDALLDVHHLLAGVGADRQHARVEALHVDLLLRDREPVFLLVRADLQLLADVRGGGRAEVRAGDLQDLDDVERLAPLLLDAELLAPVCPCLPVLQTRPIVRGLRRHARDDARALLHGYGQHGQGIDRVVRCQRRLQREAKELRAGLAQEALRLRVLQLAQALVAHVQSGAVGTDKYLAVVHLEEAILTLGQDKAIRLAVHRFRPQRRGHEEDIAATQGLGPLGRHLLDSQLDERVLHGLHAFTFGTVVVGTRLVGGDGEDALALAVIEVLFPKLLELPTNESVVVRVQVRGDEGAPPINCCAKPLEVLHGIGGKVLEPVLRVRELRHLVLPDAERLHDLVLVEAPCFGLDLRLLGLEDTRGASALGGLRRFPGKHWDLLLFLLRRLLGPCVQDGLQLHRGRRDRHACAVEGEGE